ncbi:response regulator [Oleiharenicola lentus]|uniref:response regulator n=1 Tax=Oleiharenicola lentus TaxID=2508720 RepID=UPI003F670952
MSERLSNPSEKIVVLIDDEIAYIDLLAQLLGEQLSCPVRGFTKPSEALRALPGLNVGLLITDYQMPEMNGLTLIERVQKINSDIPILMITGHSLHLTERERQEMPSLRGFVNKPFKWRTLADEIAKHWSGSVPPKVAVSAAPAGHL